MDYDPASYGYCPYCFGGYGNHRTGCPNDGYDVDDDAEERSCLEDDIIWDDDDADETEKSRAEIALSNAAGVEIQCHFTT